MNFFKNIFAGQEEKASPKFDANTKKPVMATPPQDVPISGKDAHGIIQAPIIGTPSISNGTEISTQEEDDDMFGGMEVKGEEKKESLYQPPVVEQKQESKLKIESPQTKRTVVDKKRPA